MLAEFNADTTFTQNRELSWLRFNERVLEEAGDSKVPLFERLKFLSIFTSNLDEFFMIRVGSLSDMALLDDTHIDNKSGLSAQEQLEAIYQAVRPLTKVRDKVYSALEKRLREYNVCNLSTKELGGKDKEWLEEYFESLVMPVLSPQIMDTHHPFPHLENKALYIAVMLESQQGKRFGLVPVPGFLPRVMFLPGAGLRYVLMEELLFDKTGRIFERYEAKEKAILSVTRNADIALDEETYELEEDFLQKMKKALKKRERMAPVRLESTRELNREFLQYLCTRLKLEEKQVFFSAQPLEMSYVFSLEAKLSAASKRVLTNVPFKPQLPAELHGKQSLFRQILKRDILLYYPYESMEPFVRLIGEAASDPAVIYIRITLYRIDKQSRVAEYLIMAAENGKDVTVTLELRARFDEHNNIEWAERLEEAGCRVLYGVEGFKTHSKICLIMRREKGRLQYFTQIGTGNYNEKTASLYSDFSLMTANPEIGHDAVNFFKNMAISNLDGQYKHLLVAPAGFKRNIMALIDGEIEKAQKGLPCGIMIKVNSITDRDVIDKLSQASCAGVRIDMIVRGICCILPGIPNKTENIRIVSIVGRFLEHARVYAFGCGDKAGVYIASADLMTRNTERRVEIACPIFDVRLKNRVLEILRAQLSDNVKGRAMVSDGRYETISVADKIFLNSQEQFMAEAEENTKKSADRAGFMEKVKRRLLLLGRAR